MISSEENMITQNEWPIEYCLENALALNYHSCREERQYAVMMYAILLRFKGYEIGGQNDKNEEFYKDPAYYLALNCISDIPIGYEVFIQNVWFEFTLLRDYFSMLGEDRIIEHNRKDFNRNLFISVSEEIDVRINQDSLETLCSICGNINPGALNVNTIKERSVLTEKERTILSVASALMNCKTDVVIEYRIGKEDTLHILPVEFKYKSSISKIRGYSQLDIESIYVRTLVRFLNGKNRKIYIAENPRLVRFVNNVGQYIYGSIWKQCQTKKGKLYSSTVVPLDLLIYYSYHGQRRRDNNIVIMFNTYQGDCFLIRRKKNNLIVDYGLSNEKHTRDKGKRSRLYQDERIGYVLNFFGDMSGLITNYQREHISGFYRAYMKGTLKLDRIFIPDIWSKKEYISIISKLFLEDILGNHRFPQDVSLYDFIIGLCTGDSDISFVAKNEPFMDNDYIALWPDPTSFVKKSKDYLATLEHDDIVKQLQIFSKGMRTILIDKMNGKRIKPDGIWRKKFVELSEYADYKAFENRLRQTFISANLEFESGLADEINIVFQNYTNGCDNILFTGDATKGVMKEIMSSDTIHSHYEFIKIPHHGTDSHYTDFTYYHPLNNMITNSKHGKYDKISQNYLNDFKDIPLVKVFCTNNDNCYGNCNGRKCIYGNNAHVLKNKLFAFVI